MLRRFMLCFAMLTASFSAHAACSNADMTGTWAITKSGYNGGHTLCTIRFQGNRAKAQTNNCSYVDDGLNTATFGFKGTTRFTVNSACKVTITAENTVGAILTGTAYLSRDGNNMVGLVTNQSGYPMTVNGAKLK